MIWLLKPDHPKATEFAPAMDEGTGILPGLPSVMGQRSRASWRRCGAGLGTAWLGDRRFPETRGIALPALLGALHFGLYLGLV